MQRDEIADVIKKINPLSSEWEALRATASLIDTYGPHKCEDAIKVAIARLLFGEGGNPNLLRGKPKTIAGLVGGELVTMMAAIKPVVGEHTAAVGSRSRYPLDKNGRDTRNSGC